MVDDQLKYRRLRDLVDDSRTWDVEFLIRNMEAEVDRFEHGIAHAIWGSDEKTVTKPVRPTPVVPLFEVTEDDAEYKLTVRLPGIRTENIAVEVDASEVEVFAVPDDFSCRPYYLAVQSEGVLDVESTKASMRDDLLEITVGKVRKRRVPVR